LPPERPDINRQFSTGINETLGVAERAGAWVKDQIHSGLQDFASRVFYGEPAHEQQKDVERDKGLDR
jgi:hypothetical protein